MQQGPRVRIGVVGAGWWATTAHLPALTRDPRVELAGIADLDASRAAQTAERFGAGFSTDSFEQLLDSGLDGVIIATPHDQHFEPARLALEAGADVLLEKPMTIAAEEARTLVALSRARHRRLDVGYPFLYTRHAGVLRQAISAGELGDVLNATALFATSMIPFFSGAVAGSLNTMPETMWATNASTWSSSARGGGQMLSQLTHAASLLLHLTDLRPERLFGAMDTRGMDIDLCDLIAFTTRDGAVGSLVSTGSVAEDARPVSEYRVFGTAGHAALDTVAGTLAISRYGFGTTEEPPLAGGELYPLYTPAERLVDGILDPQIPDTAELGLLTVELLAAARASAEQGVALAINS